MKIVTAATTAALNQLGNIPSPALLADRDRRPL
jgi:hypothetical protein